MKIANENAFFTYGFFEAGIPFTYRLVFNMKDFVDGEILNEALRNTEKRYPYFSVRMRRNDREYFYEKNPAPIVLLNTDERITLNSAQTNCHIWAVCYKDNRIFIDFYHGMADGGGSIFLPVTLLYYYCNIRYGVTDKNFVRTSEDEILPEETIDPLENLPRIDTADLKIANDEIHAFSPLKDGDEIGDCPAIYEIVLPENAFIKFTSENDSSPGTMILLLLDRAIDAHYPNRTKAIVSEYDINCRPMLNSPHSYQNCITFAEFIYSDRFKKIPFATQTTIYRGITFLASDADKITEKMTALSSVIKDTLDKSPTLEDKKTNFGKMIKAIYSNRTATVSYVGKWRFKSLAEHIDSSFVHVAPHGAIMIEINAINGKICLAFLQDFSDDGLIKEFLAQMEANDIKYEVVRKIKPDAPNFLEPE